MWLEDSITKLERAAHAAWPGVLEEAQLPMVGWSYVLLSKREEKDRARISYLLEHPNHGLFKYRLQLRPRAQAAFAAHYLRLEKASRAFQRSERLSLIKPMCLDIANQASLTTYAEGLPFSEYMRDAAEDNARQLELLQLAGEWLDAYHRTKVSETRIFQPKHAVNYYHDLGEKIQSGDLKVAAKPLILQGVERLSELANKYSDQQTVSAVQYGDFHMRNLIFDGTCLTGINISKNQPAPVGHDIARLLLDYTAILRSSKELESGQIIPADAIEAFFAGYRLVGPNDPSVQFLPYAKILGSLVNVPQRRNDRSKTNQKTLERLRPIARVAFT